ncbi:DUF305 domain-containing protein [Streptomyces sp. NPDC058373]|uniref:DUF305 domain-containing protein n=1 Tax=unclassified Streptomyces TaxID=2593676 RepID=UPI00365BE7BC
MPIRRPAAAHRRSVPLALAAAAAAALLTGCTGSPGPAPEAKEAPGPSVIAPGRPGEEAETLSADEAERRKPDDSPNSADFAYIQMMVEHHGQALVMTRLAPERARSERVKALAERIDAGQKPEIGAMKAWLKNNGGPRGDGKGHDHGTMAGMATPKQLAELKKADGEEFDRLFLKLMTAHHEGAVSMATDLLGSGNNVLVEEMANDVISTQTTEINRMRDMS